MEEKSKLKRGRPRLSDEEKTKSRKARKVYFSDEEWGKIERLSRISGRCRAAYIRDIVLGYNPMLPDPIFRSELIAARTDLLRYFSFVNSRNFSDKEREAFLSQTGEMRKWFETGISPIITAINKIIRRL